MGHGFLNDVSQLLWCVLCIGGRRVRGFRPPCHVFQPWESSRLVVVAVQGAPLVDTVAQQHAIDMPQPSQLEKLV